MRHGPRSRDAQGFGFLVDTPEIRALIDETRRVSETISADADRVTALRPAFAALLAADGWLPEACARPDETSRMGGGIGNTPSIAREDGSLCLFSLVVPASAVDACSRSPGVGPGGHLSRPFRTKPSTGVSTMGAILCGRNSRSPKRQTLEPGEFYTLLPPADDIHFVQTVSDTPSISIHLLANDTACIWRHRFDPASGEVTPFRSGYANAPCPPDEAVPEPQAGSKATRHILCGRPVAWVGPSRRAMIVTLKDIRVIRGTSTGWMTALETR